MSEDNVLPKCAAILVECLYATAYNEETNMLSRERGSQMNFDYWKEMCNPFIDTLDSRRQADIIEDYFEQRPDLWDLWNGFERPYVYDIGETMREWRLDRIEWCLERIEKIEERL